MGVRVEGGVRRGGAALVDVVKGDDGREEYGEQNKGQQRRVMDVVRYVSVFFFQAEDGIRDYKVTGVQTCALPICVVAGEFAAPSVWRNPWAPSGSSSPSPASTGMIAAPRWWPGCCGTPGWRSSTDRKSVV